MKRENATSSKHTEFDKLIYGITHDMGAPLRAVVQFSELLKAKVGDSIGEKERHWLELINVSGVRAQHMLQALVAYSRLTTRKFVATRFSLVGLVDELLADYRRQPGASGIRVEAENALEEAWGDRALLAQLVSHLLDNALRFCPADDKHEIAIVVAIQKNARGVALTVSDNGLGVAESSLENIFLPFKRLHAPDNYPGLGMGLAYCDLITRLHGGSISAAKSSLGGLSIVCVFPFSQSAVQSG